MPPETGSIAMLDIWSEAGAGTEVRLTVPAAIAYEKSDDGGKFKLFRKARIISTSPSSIRIMTVDDHPLLREGIAVLIKADPDMELNSLERRWTRFLSGDSIGQLSKPSNWRTLASE